MNGIPEPYPNGTHLAVRGRTVVVTDHAPNSDSWHYHGTPADLAGDCVTFAHDEATPITRPMPGPSTAASTLPAVARELMANAGLSLDVFDSEVQESPLQELLRVVADVVHHGPRHLDDLRLAYITYTEAG